MIDTVGVTRYMLGCLVKAGADPVDVLAGITDWVEAHAAELEKNQGLYHETVHIVWEGIASDLDHALKCLDPATFDKGDVRCT